jgi:hypothetical protein
VHFAGTGNYYEYVQVTDISWSASKTAAAASTYLGVPGHLATITSAEENEFIATTIDTGLSNYFAWIGGHEPADDGVWVWAVGPEAGVQFALFGSATPPHNWAPWGGVEPNDVAAGEDFAGINVGLSSFGIDNGEWGDGVDVPTSPDSIQGYVVEYEIAKIPAMSRWGHGFIALALSGVGWRQVRRRMRLRRDA